MAYSRVGVSAYGRVCVRRSAFGVRCSAFASPMMGLRRLLICGMVLLLAFSAAMANENISGSDGAVITVSRADRNLVIQYYSPGRAVERTVFVAVGSHSEIG